MKKFVVSAVLLLLVGCGSVQRGTLYFTDGTEIVCEELGTASAYENSSQVWTCVSNGDWQTYPARLVTHATMDSGTAEGQ